MKESSKNSGKMLMLFKVFEGGGFSLRRNTHDRPQSIHWQSDANYIQNWQN